MYFKQCTELCYLNFIATSFLLNLMTVAQGQQQETGITLNIFLVAFSQSLNRFYLKSFKEPYIYDVHTEGDLVISPVLSDSIVFK